jgi:hypothetical protein
MFDNVNPTVWGDIYWKMMHFVTLTYPNNPSQDDKTNFYNFFMSTKQILPCDKCRSNFNNHLIKYPLNDKVLESKQNAIEWLMMIHNEVNIITGKPMLTITDITNIPNKNTQDKTTIIITICILICLFCVVIYLCVINKYY